MTKPVTHAPVLDWVPDGLPAVSQERRSGVRVTTAAAAALGLALSGEAGVGAGAGAGAGSSRRGMIVRSGLSKPRSSSSLTPWEPDRALPGGVGGLHKGDHPLRLLPSGRGSPIHRDTPRRPTDATGQLVGEPSCTDDARLRPLDGAAPACQ